MKVEFVTDLISQIDSDSIRELCKELEVWVGNLLEREGYQIEGSSLIKNCTFISIRSGSFDFILGCTVQLDLEKSKQYFEPNERQITWGLDVMPKTITEMSYLEKKHLLARARKASAFFDKQAIDKSRYLHHCVSPLQYLV